MKNVEGALVGMLVGDALGVPYEFTLPHGIPPKEQIEYTAPEGFRRAHKNTPPGTWSDDGALALCLLASLLERKEFDAEDFAAKAADWMNNGYMAVDNRVYDIGNSTYKGLTNYFVYQHDPLMSGPSEEKSNGNGSLMRVLPLALWHKGDDEDLVRDARLQSRCTHGHLRSQLACAVYCLWARRLASGEWPSTEAAYQGALDAVIRLHDEDPAIVNEINRHFRSKPVGTGTGYVMDSLHSTRMVLSQTDNYEDCVKEAIRLGHDTDTTACIAGGIAGLLYGLPGIPKRWVEELRGTDTLMPLLNGLRAWLSAS